MVGPHLAYLLDEVDEITGDGHENVKVGMIKPEYYSTLDGDKALDQILSLVEGN